MFKRKLLKRVLPIILSVAMVFEMMPADALAAEYDEAGTVQETELEENNSDSRETEADNAETKDADVQEESGTPQETETAVKESSTSRETATAEAGTDENGTASGEETEKKAEDAEEGDTQPQQELTAKIVVDDKKVDEYAKKDNGFTRRLGESGIAFFTEYVEESKCGGFQDAVKDWLRVEIDGERIDTLKDKLTYNWVKKAESGEEEGKETPLVNAMPGDAGAYELIISMDLANLEGICKKLESDVKISLTIEKADIELDFAPKTDPGKTAGELIDAINEGYTIKYKTGKYNVSRDILVIKDEEGKEDSDKKLPLNIFMLDEGGARQPMEMTDKFDRTKDYVLAIGDIALTENAVRNYKLSVDDSYMITVGERQKTEVRFERKNSGEDLIQAYDETKSWTIDEVTEGLFTEDVTDANGVVTKTGAPAVYIHGEDDKENEFSVLLEGAETDVSWYTRIRLNNGEQYVVDEESGEIKETENGTVYIYKPMASDPGDAGEYFIIWSYAGDDSAYEKSHSEAVRFTIDPVPVVIKTSQEIVEEAGFCDGMTSEDVRKTLAKLSYDVYPLVENETTGAIEISDTPVATTPDFFGTSYMGDVENQATQYFVPEFVLQRRVTKLTEKGEATVTVDPKAVDWKTVELSDAEKLRVVIDAENDKLEFNTVSTTELPNDVSKGNLESVEFEFRIYFTGNKVVYDKDGYKVSLFDNAVNKYVTVRIPVTDVTTHAANRNYLADITKKRLEDTAVAVNIKSAESVQIVTDAIVEAFIADNAEMLYPQPAEGEEPRNIHQGTLEKPAVKIYDQKSLFTDRASYKKAAVHKINEEGGPGEALSVSPTDKELQYTWNYITLDKYEEYLETWDEVQRQYRDLEEYSYLWKGWIDVDDGALATFKSAGLYRLTVTYDDPAHEYQSAKADVFFKVERQELVIVPTEKYARIGENINAWKNGLEKKIGEDFIIYKLPHNSMEEFNALATDEDKTAYILPTEEAAAAFEAENGRKPDLELGNLEWKVLRKEKNPETGEDTAEWIEAAETEFDDDFTYGTAAHWTGNLLELEDENIWENYTTKDIKTLRETGEEKHHEAAGSVRFYELQLYAEVDAQKIKALGHEYDGNPVSLEEVAKALTFYKDEALTQDSKIATETVVNMTEEYDPSKVNIYWQKAENNAVYANKNAVYGGKYTLRLRFAGGTLTLAEGEPETTQDDAAITYAPNVTVYYVNESEDTDRSFTITPHEITITPKTLPEGILMAGDKADVLLTEEIDVQGLIENELKDDQQFFEYAEIAAGSFDITWDGSNEDGTDKDGFAYKYNINKNGGYPAFNGAAQYIIQVDGRDIKDPAKEYLRFGSTYTVKLQNELVSPLKESYNVTYKTTEVKIEKRGNAEVTATDDNRLSANGIAYNFSESIYTVRPRGAVRFYDNNNNVNVIGRDGAVGLNTTNILGFRIYAPREFLNNFKESREKFVYKNAVWNAGGYFLGNVDWQEDNKGGYIDVVFPLTKENTERSFNITWENEYTETFTLADIVLEEDLTKAVAPKSIAFNGVSTKMAVGEKQQLNLKITKAQLGDVIAVRYRIKDGGTKNDFISIDPVTGVVTALKAGKTATVVEAYPVYQDAKGNFVPVLDSKGKEAKAASAKITVTEVTKASVKKITAQGNSIKLYYVVPNDGYRREIYLVDVTKGTEYQDRKKWKPADFNEAIAGMTNGEWENAGFAVQPIYSYAKNEDLDTKEANGTYDKKLKAHIMTIDSLTAEREYAIYVRNVSAARALDDGSVVTLSADGTVKKFKTTKPQVRELQLGFTIKTDENDKKNVVTHPVNEDGTIDVGRYTVELSAKKAQLNVYGLFSDKEGGSDAAEADDLRRYSLVPTLKEEKEALKKYQLPKLEYVIYDEEPDEAFAPGLVQSKYAAISNKGQISLKGVDLNGEKTVYIFVRDKARHEDDFWDDAGIELTITAKPASMTGKKVKAKVGQAVKLSDCLEYKDAKKKKIPDYRSCGVMITKEMLAAAKESGYRIEDLGADPLTHDWYITAVAPNKTNFDLAVTDFDAEGNPMEAVVKLTSTQIDPVKGLKVTYVDDQNITIAFTHPSNLDENDTGSVYNYAFEIKDARGNVVDKIVLSNPNKVFDIDGVNAKELKRVQSWFQHSGTWVDGRNPKQKTIVVAGNVGFNYYTGTKTKTKTFAYTYTNPKLVRLSNYTISVTPLFENQKADKAASTKTKTTNIPACPGDIDITGAGTDKLGGHNLFITSSGRQNGGNAGAANNITDRYRLISGNTYTLQLVPDDNAARDRVTDTLAWKSSNTKVASVKANAGTYTATFKAVNQGRTTITVTSKITKKVIARWAVTVYAVKDGSSYGGDYEPTWQNGFYENILALYDPFYEGRLEVLSLNVPLEIHNKDAEGNNNPNVRTWVSFTAPHYGQYTFSHNIPAFFDSRDGKRIGGGMNLFLEAGQKVYFSVLGNATLSVTGTELSRLTKAHTKDAPLEVKAGYISFTAWEDNVYTFWYNGKKLAIDGETESGMKAGETKFIQITGDGKMYVTYREEVAAEELKLESHPTGTITIDKDNQVRYISFTAGADGEYKFTYQKVDGVDIDFWAADGSNLKEVYNDITADGTAKRFYLKKDEKVVIEFKAAPEITDATKTFTVSVTVTAQQRRKLENNTITIPKGTKEIVEYVIPSFTTEKAKFKFAVSGENGTEIVEYLNEDYEHPNNIQNNTLTVSKDSDIKTGDSIYIVVQAGGSADDKDAKDAVLTVTRIPVDTLTVNTEKTLEITNDTEQWYTFTAPKDGFYEFAVTVAERAEGDNTPTHSAYLAICKELFGTLLKTNIKTEILAMKFGETFAVDLKHGYQPDIEKEGATKEDGTKEESTWEVVKSNAAVSVKEIAVQPLALGKENAVQVPTIPAKGKEVHYYSFTASVEADYTILWQPADAKTDNAKVTYFNKMTAQSGAQTVAAAGSKIKLKTGEVRYIKVEIDDAESENPVNGTLCVTAEALNVDVLTVNKEYHYLLEDKNGKGAQKIVKFTALEAGNYAVIITADNNPHSELPYAYPEITTDIGNVGVPNGSIKFKKGETKYFTLSFTATGEVKETAGTIMIRSLTELFTGEQMDVSVANGNVKEYTYIIPESGRYEFKADYDKEKASVEWKDVDDKTLGDGNYYQKNTKVKAAVTGRDEEAEASVKLYKPALISTTALNVGENPIEVKAGETKYYELSVGNEPKIYEFELSDITSLATVNMKYVIDNSSVWKTLSADSEVAMEKNSKLTIKITSSSEKKDASCKLNVTERQELKLGENPIHLEPGQTLWLTYRARETGYYSFNVNQPNAELVFNNTTTGGSFYDFTRLTATGTRTCRLTNDGSSVVDLTFIVGMIEPVELTPGSKTEAKTILAGQRAHYALKTFKNAEYRIKITDTGKGEDLTVFLDGTNVTGELKKTADSVILEKTLNDETFLYIINNSINETTVTVELTMTEAQPLPNEAIMIAKNESRLVSFVATEDTRYLITKDNEKVKMTLVSEQKVSDGTTTNPNVNDYAERVLNKGDKLIYRLSYDVDETDKKAEDSQTVNVKIEKIVPASIEAESVPVTIAEKDNKSVWYQFTAAKDAIHTFVLEDELGNEVSNRMTFYRYFTDVAGQTATERHMKTGRKVYINVRYPDAGSYTLKYTTVEAVTETGSKTLDFNYNGEVQEVKFVVPKGGIYKVSATAVRGSFGVAGKTGTRMVVGAFTTNGGRTSEFLKKDDIVTLTITAAREGKSSVTLRIAEDNMAETLESGREYASDTEKDIYHELRIAEKALYAITASGEPVIAYAVNDDAFETINGVVYKELDKDDRIIIKVGQTMTEKVYTVKVEKVNATSLDGRNKEEEPYSLGLSENYYGFTTAKAYVQFKVPEDGNYYIAVQPIKQNTGYNGMSIVPPAPIQDPEETPALAAKASPYIITQTLIKDHIVKFTFTNDNPKDEENPAKEYEEALFKLTIAKAPADENSIGVNETKSGSLAARAKISYQFKAAEEGKYIISFNGSNCTLSGSSDGEVKKLAKDETLTLTVRNDSDSKAGSYELKVTKLNPEPLTLGTAAQKTLKKGETVYYEFASTETTDTGETKYQIYISGDNVYYTYSIVDAEGKEERIYNYYGNCNLEFSLKKGEKLFFAVKNYSETMTMNFRLTVKKVDYTAVKADTPVSGSLEACENGYYEFTSVDDSAEYMVSIAGSDSVQIQSIQKAALEKDSEGNDVLGMPTDVTDQKTVTLNKGEKLLITTANNGRKASQFELTVEKAAGADITYDAIALDETKTGKLAKDEKAGYEFTVSDAADYSVYFTGTSCGYTLTTTEEKQVTGEDGNPTTKTETVTKTGTLSRGSNEFTWKKDDKIRFTISGTAKYELIVKKVEYTPLTLGNSVSKTLNKGETAYYQFVSQDTPAAGETTTNYQDHCDYQNLDYTIETRIVTVGEDGKTTETEWQRREGAECFYGYDLEKGQILQFRVTNKKNASPFKLVIEKVQYELMTLGTVVEGRLNDSDNIYAYYEFTSQDTPAEGQTTTKYQVYGTAVYYFCTVSEREDKTLVSSDWFYYAGGAREISLAKGWRLRFRVIGTEKSDEGYNLTVAKTDEKTITVGSNETGRLGKGQELVYTLKYDKDTPTTYTLSYEQNDKVSVTVIGGNRIDEQRIELTKDNTLKITIKATYEIDNFEFTLSEFKPETMALGTMTGLKKLALRETAYYQYVVGEDGTYVLSMVESESDGLNLGYEINREESTVANGYVYGGVGEITLQKDDVVLFKVKAPDTKALAAFSFRLMLQKKPADDALTALPWNGTLKQGEVKYFKFTIPEEQETDGTKYTVSILCGAGTLKCNSAVLGNTNITPQHEYNNEDVTSDFVIRVANTSMYYEAECSIDVQENPYVTLSEKTKTGTIAKGETEYYKYTPSAQGNYRVDYSGSVKVQYSTDKTATKSWTTASNTDKRKINMEKAATPIYLKISHSGAEETADYTVSIEEVPYEVPENFALRASAAAACIGSDKIYLYLDTDIEVDQITVLYGKKGSASEQQISLYDDGNVSHGDDMKGDGTYSAILYPAGTEDMEMLFTARYGSESSNLVTVKYYTPLTDDIYAAMDAVDGEIDKLLDASDFAEKTDDEKLEMVTNLLDGLAEEEKIVDNSIVVNETNSIVSFRYTGEILGGVMYGEFDEDSNGELDKTGETDTTDKRGGDKQETASYPERNTYIPESAYANAISTEQNQDIGKALILNSFPGFETSSGAITFRTEFYETLKSEWDEAGLKTLLDTNVTVDDYKKLHNYNVVCISTHGSIYPVSQSTAYPAICLNQPQSGENNKKYMAELKNQQIAKVNGSYWILPSFFTAQYGEDALQDTFVFSECCMAMGSDESGSKKEMANAFTGRGAKAYIGFYNSVLAVYSREFMKEYVNNLIDGQTSIDAYNTAVNIHGANDGQKEHPARPVHNGNESAVLVHNGLQNGEFEDYNYATTAPRIWACMGDVRTLTQIGEVKPYDGSKRMAIITTGIGAKESAVFDGGTEGSMLSQTFRVPNNAQKLCFNYDFISEEPMEFVGSIFDDNFGIRISTGGNTVLNKTYESINTSEWTVIDGINFAGGDDTAFHTDWKTAEVDISEYSGKVITLSFIIYDVGDQIYDSACVIDNVMLQ